MPKPDLRSVLNSWLEKWIPRGSTKAFYNARSEPQFMANRMDVDYLRGVLASAEAGNVRDLFALYRDVLVSDSHLQAEFDKRKLAVLGDAISIQPVDKTNPDDVQAAKAIAEMVTSTPRFLHACSHLLDSTLYPVALVEKVYKVSTKPGLRFEVAALNVVPHLDLDYSSGFMELWDIDPITGYLTGNRRAPDANRFIVHRGHLLQMPDYWGGPFRCLLFWWLMSTMDRDWWARFLERYGSPFIVGKYDQADDSARAILTQAFQAASKIFGLVVSDETQVELMQSASQATGEAFAQFKEVCDDEKSKRILGQTGSAKTAPSGMGGGVNKQHESVRQDIRQFDQTTLADTMADQLFKPYLDINGIPGAIPKMVWGGVSIDEQISMGTLLANLAQAGYELTDEGLSTLGEKIAMPLQRKAVPAVPAAGGPTGFSVFSAAGAVSPAHSAIDRIAQNGSADLSQAFRGSLAPVRRIIVESRSAAECEARIREFYADWKADRVAGLVGDALTAYAANGSVIRNQ
jgi:phage gp29-like protein